MDASTTPVIMAPIQPDAAIAQIEADRDVAIAEIVATTQQASTEAAVDIATVVAEQEDEDVAWLRNELVTLRQLCATTAGECSRLTAVSQESQSQIASLTAMLTQHIQTPTPPAHSLPAMGATPSSEATDGPAASEGDRSAAEPAPEPPMERKARKLRFL